jgi:hypothetical protein
VENNVETQAPHADSTQRGHVLMPRLFAARVSLGTSRHGEHTPGRGYGATPASCAAAASL